MTVDEAIICLSDMKIKVAIPKAAVQARLNNDALDMAIEALKCSEIPNNWVPCSERLPEPWTLVLVTDRSKDVRLCQMHHNSSDGWYDECDNWIYFSTSVIAWLPLPEPYQGGGKQKRGEQE